MRFLITYSIEIFYFHIYHEDFYGLSNNVLHGPGDSGICMRIRNLKSENVIRYMQCAQVMEGLFKQKASFLITYSIEIFYFHIYHEDFYGLSNNVLHFLGTWLFLYVLATWKLDSAKWYIQNAQVTECFSSITSAFSNYLFYRNFLFSHISWRFLWSF